VALGLGLPEAAPPDEPLPELPHAARPPVSTTATVVTSAERRIESTPNEDLMPGLGDSLLPRRLFYRRARHHAEQPAPRESAVVDVAPNIDRRSVGLTDVDPVMEEGRDVHGDPHATV
jgi:hypothetical protein